LAITEYTSQKPSLINYFKSIWRHKELTITLAVRDIKIYYSQTIMGLFWAVIQPLVALVIYTVFFYKILGISTGDIPYPLFVFPGVMIWFNFIQIINEAGTSLKYNQELIRKVEFPRIILPISKALTSLVNMFISFILVLLLDIYYGIPITWCVLFFPIVVLLNLLLGLSVGIWLSALSIKYRDFQHIVPYLINFLIWVSPVFYPVTILPDKYENLIFINPITSVLTLSRWSLVGDVLPEMIYFLNLIPVFLLFLFGIIFFRKIEREIVDVI
jgi:lipopolysaccharide transport system permease protein